MDQFEVGRQHILQPESINGVCVAPAHFHQAVVAAGISQPPNLLGSPSDNLRIAEFVNVLHCSPQTQDSGLGIQDSGRGGALRLCGDCWLLGAETKR
jgi:hypothetical protein